MCVYIPLTLKLSMVNQDAVEAFRCIAEWDANKSAWVYKNNRYRGCTKAIYKYRGDVIGCPDEDGYYRIGICKLTYRLAYAAHHNVTLTNTDIIDHINGIRTDNNINNLRLCTANENGKNLSKIKGCTSTYKGVYWRSDKRKWRVRIKVNGKRISLGYSHSEIDAAMMYNEAAIKYHGVYAKLNEIHA